MIQLDFEAKCSECGKPLDVTDDSLGRNETITLIIAPCETCLEAAADEAREEAR